jgi:DNA-binding NarL/FixJ family response regulator
MYWKQGESYSLTGILEIALNPDVVLLDVAMPNFKGIDAAGIIKKCLPSATIYFVTQYDSLEMARATAEAGTRGYISKVHIPTDLVPAIEPVSTSWPLKQSRKSVQEQASLFTRALFLSEVIEPSV